MKSYDGIKNFALSIPGHTNKPDEGGAFALKVGKQTLRIIASWGGGWDHVSVSLPHRCPTWEEMETVKRAFFQDHEAAYQIHAPPADHVNIHPYTLHIWRPQAGGIPMPPKYMV